MSDWPNIQFNTNLCFSVSGMVTGQKIRPASGKILLIIHLKSPCALYSLVSPTLCVFYPA